MFMGVGLKNEISALFLCAVVIGSGENYIYQSDQEMAGELYYRSIVEHSFAKAPENANDLSPVCISFLTRNNATYAGSSDGTYYQGGVNGGTLYVKSIEEANRLAWAMQKAQLSNDGTDFNTGVHFLNKAGHLDQEKSEVKIEQVLQLQY